MKRIIFFTLMISSVFSSFATNDTVKFKPSGKPFAKIYSNYHSGTNQQSDNNGFEISRAYLGYGYNFTSNWSANATLDVGNPKAGGLEMTAYLKNASLTYEKNKILFRFGMITMLQFKEQEKFWGYRYILKSFQDEYKFANSADIGATAQYKLNKFISFDITASNGEGYKKLQSDETYRGGLGMTVHPIKFLTFRYYYDHMQKAQSQTTHALFLGYKFKKKFSIGAEYNIRENHNYKSNVDIAGVSLYATYFINKKINLFGRFDKVESSISKTQKGMYSEGDYYISGLEFKPTKGINISLNHRYAVSPAIGASDKSYVYFNFEYSF